jgi:hypothetical protein
MSSFFNRIRSKSISSINQLIGPPGYCYIENFEFTTEEECIKIDNDNLNLYRKNKSLYDELTKKIEIKNALFKIEKAPMPPLEPNNYEKFIKYKERNITKNVRLQTFAVQKLLEKGYRLHYDNIENKTDIDFEPYQAIELLEKIDDDSIDNIFKTTMNMNKTSPQLNKKNQLSSSAPEYSQFLNYHQSEYQHQSQAQHQHMTNYQPQPQHQHMTNYQSVYPTAPPLHVINKNVAPPASHYISNA